MKVFVDFDNTLVVWPRDRMVQYRDVFQAMCDCAAVLGAVRWVKRQLGQGHEVTILTGRDETHAAALRYWSYVFLGEGVPVVLRPSGVGLSCGEQAAWKAQELQARGADLYLGDNLLIDLVAARMAGVAFLHAGLPRSGFLPVLEDCIARGETLLPVDLRRGETPRH
jgi:hypothetical protein